MGQINLQQILHQARHQYLDRFSRIEYIGFTVGIEDQHARYFKLPEDLDVRSAVVEAVPPNWSLAYGILEAPSFLVQAGEVVSDTGLRFGKSGCIPMVIGRYNNEQGRNARPDLVDLFANNKLPGFVRFDQAGDGAYSVSELKFEDAKKIASSFVRKGYKGEIQFYGGYNSYSNICQATCSMALEPWLGASVFREESGPQPPRVKLKWQRAGNGESAIAPLIEACLSLNLREYQPKVKR